MTTALIINAYSARNAGDAAITLATATLLQHLGIDRVMVATRHAEEDQDFYASRGITTVEPLTPFPRRGQGSTIARSTVLGFGLLKGRRAFRRHAAAASADLVVLSGGGYLYSASRAVNGTLIHAANASRLALRSGLPVVMMPQSIGPFSRRIDQAIVRAGLRDLTTVVVREEVSASIAQDIGLERVEICPDIAFLGWQRIQVQSPATLHDQITVVPMDWSWASARGGALVDAYILRFARLLEALAESGCSVAVAGHSSIPEQAQDDSLVAQAILAAMRADLRENVVTHPYSDIDALASIYARSDLVIGTRLHSCIAAMVAGTPTIHLSYQPKGVGTYSMLGLVDRCASARDFDSTEIARLATQVLENAEAERRRVADAVASARERITKLYTALVGEATR